MQRKQKERDRCLLDILDWRQSSRQSNLQCRHRADLPILPGNLGSLPLLGFGLWAFPVVSIVMESILIVAGGALYFSSALSRAKEGGTQQAGRRTWAIIAGVVMCSLLVLSLVTDVTGIG
jgi:hypothetical protein